MVVRLHLFSGVCSASYPILKARCKLQLNVLSRILCQHWVKSVSTYRELWRFKSIEVYSAENGAVSIALGLHAQRSFHEAVNRLSFYFVFLGAVFHGRFIRLILAKLVFILSIIHVFVPILYPCSSVLSILVYNSILIQTTACIPGKRKGRRKGRPLADCRQRSDLVGKPGRGLATMYPFDLDKQLLKRRTSRHRLGGAALVKVL